MVEKDSNSLQDALNDLRDAYSNVWDAIKYKLNPPPPRPLPVEGSAAWFAEQDCKRMEKKIAKILETSTSWDQFFAGKAELLKGVSETQREVKD